MWTIYVICAHRDSEPGADSIVSDSSKITPPKDPSALKYCFHGQHSKPESTFKLLPGTKQKRRVCAECYTKIMADRRSKERAQRTG